MSAVAVDPRPFGRDWWMQPLLVRFFALAAIQAGLGVEVQMRRPQVYWRDRDVEIAMITWRGTKAQLVATGYFLPQFLDRIVRSRWCSEKGIYGQVSRLNADEFLYAVEGAVSLSKIRLNRRMEVARSDERFLNFRDAVMTGYPLASLEDQL
jgi:hypothetical protein